MSNLKVLRLNNTANNPKLSLVDNNSGFKYIVEPSLRNRGRCLVTVISGWSQITRQTLNGGNVNATDRIVPNNASFNQTDSLTFLCNELPSQIHIERLYYNDANVLVNADNLAGNELVPCEVTLSLNFVDM